MTLARQCLFAGGAFGILVSALGLGAAAQPASIPDFSSNQTSWIGGIGVDFTAVEGSPSPLRQDPAHPFVPNGAGKQPTYRIADLSNPNLTQWAKDIMKKDNDEVLAGKIAYAPHQSCLPAGVPDFDFVRGARPIYFIQTPREVLMIWEGDHQFRHIYLNVPHSKNPKPSWFG